MNTENRSCVSHVGARGVPEELFGELVERGAGRSSELGAGGPPGVAASPARASVAPSSALELDRRGSIVTPSRPEARGWAPRAGRRRRPAVPVGHEARRRPRRRRGHRASSAATAAASCRGGGAAARRRASAPSIGSVRATLMPPGSIPSLPGSRLLLQSPRQCIGDPADPTEPPDRGGPAARRARRRESRLALRATPIRECAMFEWPEELQMVRDAVRTVRRQRDPPAPRGARARRPAAVRPAAQAVQDVRHGPDGRRRLRQAHRGARRARRASREDAERGERRRWRRVHAAADHRALQVLAGHGHRDGRVGRPHRGRDHVEGHDRAEEALGARHRSRWTRSARGRSPSPTPAPTRSGRCRRPRAATATSTCSTARRRSSPTARTPTRSCSSASSTRATPPADRKVVQFVLDTGMPGLEQSKPLRKMGLHSSPTGMLFLDDVRVGTRPPARRERGGVRRQRGPRGVEGDVRRWSARASRRWRSASSSAASSCA